MADLKFGPGKPKNWRPMNMWASLGTGERRERFPLIQGEHPHSYDNGNARYLLTPDVDKYGSEPVAFAGHIRPMRIELEEHNVHKGSGLSGDEVRATCHLRVFVEEIEGKEHAWVLVYELARREMDACIHWWLANKHEFEEHAVDWWRASCRARLETGEMKVWWHDQPGKVTGWIPDQGCVLVQPDGIDRFESPARFGELNDHWDGDWVKDDIFSPHIRWHRGV